MARPPNIKPQRNRQNMPSGYVVGRSDPGKGHEQLIPMTELARALSATGQINAGTKLNHAFLGFFGQGPFTASQFFPLAGAFEEAIFPADDLTLDKANCVFAPTVTTQLFLVTDVAQYLNNGSTLVCTVTFLANEKTGTFAWNGSTTVNPGDILWLVLDDTANANFAGVQVIFAGNLA